MNNSNHNQGQQQSTIIMLSSIPFDQTEEQILDLCNSIGPVKSLKMVFDPLTGRSKGTCFIEYKDLTNSGSAVRNLNGYLLGNRNLKCRYADPKDNNVITMRANSENNDIPSTHASDDNNFEDVKKYFTVNGQVVNPDTIGIDVNTNMTTPAMMLSSTIGSFSKKDQFQILQLLKQESNEKTGMTLKLLNEFPQLSYAVAEILLTNGITNVEQLTELAIAQEDAVDKEASKNADLHEGFADEDGNMTPHKLKQQQVVLLRKVLQLSDAEISLLPQDEKVMVYDLQQRAMRGDFGLI